MLNDDGIVRGLGLDQGSAEVCNDFQKRIIWGVGRN